MDFQLRSFVDPKPVELSQRAVSSIIVITIIIWGRFHNWRQIWSNKVKCFTTLEIFFSHQVGVVYWLCQWASNLQPQVDSQPLQLHDGKQFWIIFHPSKFPQIFKFSASPPCFQETIGNTKFFQMKVETLKRVYIFFSLLVCDGLSLKMNLENKLFTMLKSVSEGSWVQTPNFPS